MAKPEEGGEHLFLGEPQWESLAGGRVRCVQTGHEMPLAAQPTYAFTKKCRSALFDAALKNRTPPLNFFDQSPDAKDKIICKLTGVALNKREDAVWKHMLGKKFEQKLAEKEAEREIARKDVEMTDNCSEKPSSKIVVEVVNLAGDGGTGRTKKKKAALATLPEADEQGQEDANSDDSDFWVPPAGARWDFDVGSNDRWSVPLHHDPEYDKAVNINGHIQATSQENASKFDNGDTEMLDGEDVVHDSDSSDDGEVNIRTKRTVPSSELRSRSHKKRGKRMKAESSRQKNGV